MSAPIQVPPSQPSSLPEIYEHAAGLSRWLRDEQAKHFRAWLEDQRAAADKRLRTSSNEVDIYRAQGFIMLADAITQLEKNLTEYLMRSMKGTGK